jgi:hypothetical protein
MAALTAWYNYSSYLPGGIAANMACRLLSGMSTHANLTFFDEIRSSIMNNNSTVGSSPLTVNLKI